MKRHQERIRDRAGAEQRRQHGVAREADCHGGVYGSAGQVEGGPPVRPLDRFYTKVSRGRVEIGDRFSVNSELRRFKPRDPSNHLDGLWEYL